MDAIEERLLASYAQDRSEGAFRQIVERYGDLVYSAAYRRLQDHQLAEDASQATFIIFAQKAAKLRKKPMLGGWFWRTATYVASNIERTRAARARRERESMELDANEPDSAWERMAPELDAALATVPAGSRELLIARYLRGKSLQALADELGLHNSTVHRRITRALLRLRRALRGKGVAVAPALLVSLLSTRTAEAVSIEMLDSIHRVAFGISSGSVAATGAAYAAAKGVLRMIMWQRIKVLAACVLAAAGVGGGVAASLARGAGTADEDWLNWVHLPGFYPDHTKMVLKKCKDVGYDKVVVSWPGRTTLGLVEGDKFARQEIEEVIRYAKDELKIDVVPGTFLLGKAPSAFGDQFLKDHRELFCGNVIDPFYKMKNGKTVMDNLILPLIDRYIEVYQNPSHFHLGWDEIRTDYVKAVADRNGVSIGDVWAGTLNRVCDHLLTRNVTPMIFGEQLLSPTLAGTNNVLGYPGDKRFATFIPLYSVHPKDKKTKTDLLPFVKDIRNRDKIAVVPWHYNFGSREGAYPCVEYYQWLGFKEIYGGSWFPDQTINSFAQYARKTKCAGMMATLWHVHFIKYVRPIAWPLLENSMVYFENPDVELPADIYPRIRILKNNRPVAAVRPGDTVRLTLEAPGRDLAFNLRPNKGDDLKGFGRWIKPLDDRAEWMHAERGKHDVEWTAGEPGFYDVIGETHKAHGLLHQGFTECALLVTDEAAARSPMPGNCLLGADFTRDAIKHAGKHAVALRGRGNAKYAFLMGSAKATREGIECGEQGAIRICRSGYDSHSLVNGRTVMIEFKFARTRGNLSGVFSWGNHQRGFQVFLTKDRQIWAQMAYGPKPLRLKGNTTLEPDRWHRVVFGADRNGMHLFVNNKKEAQTAVAPDWIWTEPYYHHTWLGAVQGNRSATDAKHLRNYLDGTYRQFGVWDRYVPEPRL